MWVVTRHQYGISMLVSQTPFRGKTSVGVARRRLFSPAKTTRRSLFTFINYLNCIHLVAHKAQLQSCIHVSGKHAIGDIEFVCLELKSRLELFC